MKISEITRKLGKFLKTIGNYSVRSGRAFLGFVRRHSIALIALCISIIGSSPVTSRFLIYYAYEPKLMVGFPSPSPFDGETTINFSEVLEPNRILNIINRDTERYMRIEIEFVASKPIKKSHQFGGYFVETGLGGGGFRFLTEVFYLPAQSTLALSYPFEPYSEEFSLEIIIHSKMAMDEFGWPTFFGDIELRPFRKTFTIVP